MENLKKLLKGHHAKIVVSYVCKEGRRSSVEFLKLFKLHSLEKDVIDFVNYTTVNLCEPMNLQILKDNDKEMNY